MAKESKEKTLEKSKKEKLTKDSSTSKAISYTYQAIVSSQHFNRVTRHLLGVILNPNKCYTLEQVEKILDKELKRKVL